MFSVIFLLNIHNRVEDEAGLVTLLIVALGDITVFLGADRRAIGSVSSLSIFHAFICSQRLIRQLAAR